MLQNKVNINKRNVGSSKSNNKNNIEIKEEIENNEINNSQIINIDNSKNIKLVFNSNSNSKGETNFFKNNLNELLKFGDDFDFDILDDKDGNKIEDSDPLKKYIGNCGEAYIYEFFYNSRKYKNVTWKMLTEKGKGELFKYNGNEYYINNSDRTHYDIEVETFLGNKYYIEVKATKHELKYKVPFYLGKKQIDLMKSVKYPDKYILAVVFDVLKSPKHFLMLLSENI